MLNKTRSESSLCQQSSLDQWGLPSVGQRKKWTMHIPLKKKKIIPYHMRHCGWPQSYSTFIPVRYLDMLGRPIASRFCRCWEIHRWLCTREDLPILLLILRLVIIILYYQVDFLSFRPCRGVPLHRSFGASPVSHEPPCWITEISFIYIPIWCLAILLKYAPEEAPIWCETCWENPHSALIKWIYTPVLYKCHPFQSCEMYIFKDTKLIHI